MGFVKALKICLIKPKLGIIKAQWNAPMSTVNSLGLAVKRQSDHTNLNRLFSINYPGYKHYKS